LLQINFKKKVMQKNWYIIYTRSRAENRVSKLLTRKKIENYVPVNSKAILHSKKRKIQKEPLFQSYLFANISEDEIPLITSFRGVVNFVYWKQHPVKVANEDIMLIKEFTKNYINIEVQKIEVNINNLAKIIDGSQRRFNGSVLTIKNTISKVVFPAIGFSIFAEARTENMAGIEVVTHENFTHLTSVYSKQTFVKEN
jgi:transcription antitermination factor NusG